MWFWLVLRGSLSLGRCDKQFNIENDHDVLYTVCSHSVGIVIRMFHVMLLDDYYSLKEIKKSLLRP